MKIRKLNNNLHRDLGYFFSSLIIIYCLSGIALNHIDDWNPDFILTKKDIKISEEYTREDIDESVVKSFDSLVGEDTHKLYDFPTKDRIKIYYQNATLQIDLESQTGIYEAISKRPVFYHSNLLHRNSLKGWKWISDIFAFTLIFITVSGLFVLKGKNGFSKRGKWFFISGFLIPLVAILINAFL